MKVGILTFHRVPNVGAYLQCASLVRAVRNLGHDVEVIDYAPPDQLKLSKPSLGRLVAGICREPRKTVGGLRSFWNTASHFRAAQEDIARLPLGPRIGKTEGLLDLNYGRIILGSDEIWNVHNPLMALDLSYAGIHFKNKALCAYAPSFGSVENLSDLPPGMDTALGRIEHLSGRDENTVNLLAKLGLKSTLVLDPTLLGARIPVDGSIARTGNRIIIYAAPIGTDFLDTLRSLAQRQRLRLLSIMYPQHIQIPHRSDVASHEFLQQFAEARAVVTNTFHGAIFAVLAGKPFAVVALGAKRNKITSLLRLLGIENHLVEDADQLEEVLAMPSDSKALNARLQQASSSSMEFLKHALA